jgi:competence ComEA-like helix-hairpin-helix protein
MSRESRRLKLERRREAMAVDDMNNRRFFLIIGAFFVVAVAVLLLKNWIASGPVDLNKAPVEKLETLPGIGPETAKAIVKGRPYGNLEELDRVKGIGPAMIEKLRERVKVGD